MSISFDEVSPGTGIVSAHITGMIRRFTFRQSDFVDPRFIDIWFPPSYGLDRARRYPVLYMHDGQNLFEPSYVFTDSEWEVDEWMTRLMQEGVIRETIVVGIWNTEKRFREYQPGKPFQNQSDLELKIRQQLDLAYNGSALGDAYLSFIVEELKPYLDRNFQTLPERENTFIMGSSMGGIISIYALAEYPEIFGGAACLSTHFPFILGDNAEIPPVYIQYLKAHLPRPGQHRIYFDYGTATYDAWYEPYQKQMDLAMQQIGYRQGEDWVTLKFEGAEHSEIAWKQRLHIPLIFLLAHP